MGVWAIKKIKFRSRLYPYAIEFIVITISIFLSFELDDYGEYLSNREKEDAYLTRLYDDFTKDINQLDRKIESYDEKLVKLERLKYFVDRKLIDHDSIHFLYSNYLIYLFLYNPLNSTFESLKSSGDIGLISNGAVKITLSELDKEYTISSNTGTSLINLTQSNVWISFFAENIDNGSFQRIIGNPHLANKFQNLLTLYSNDCKSYFYALQGVLEKTKEARELILSELKLRKVKVNVATE